MPDREKVIKALEYCKNEKNSCIDCFYRKQCSETGVKADAIALLKEQEAEISRISNAYLELVGKASKKPTVVRCKDCKWWDKKDDSNYGYCHACKHGYHSDHWEIGIYRTYKGDWFCADGRKNNA